MPLPADDPRSTHFATYPLCEAACGIAVITKDGAITDIRSDTEDPASRGHLCPKAIELTVRGIRGVQARYGRDALAVYIGNPTVHSLGAMLFVPPFSKSLGTRNRYSATSVDQLPHHVASLFTFGHPLLIPVPDIDRTSCWIIFDANPRRTETADLASAHHVIRPGTDALALMAMLQVIFADKLAKPGRVADFTDGLEALQQACAPFTPERESGAAGMDAEVIVPGYEEKRGHPVWLARARWRELVPMAEGGARTVVHAYGERGPSCDAAVTACPTAAPPECPPATPASACATRGASAP